MSHSLRSAWIEIKAEQFSPPQVYVALLTECVDRNIVTGITLNIQQMSHSLRSAWIEIRQQDVTVANVLRSHSLRSAWIEMF